MIDSGNRWAAQYRTVAMIRQRVDPENASIEVIFAMEKSIAVMEVMNRIVVCVIFGTVTVQSRSDRI